MNNLVETWDDILNNFQLFKAVQQYPESITFKRLNSFYHWYYLPILKTFAPSKFLGYKDITILTYDGKDGSGTETQKALKKHFTKLDESSSDFKNLYSDLQSFLKENGKKASEKVINGTGGIYIPINDNPELKYNQSLLNVITVDMLSQNDENSEEDVVFKEGLKKGKYISYYERKPKLRTKAIMIHKKICQVCGFDFEYVYGDRGKDYIEVHHKIPLFHRVKEEEIDPVKDLCVLCSNCHRMIHRCKDEVLSIEELKKEMNDLVAKRKKFQKQRKK